MKDLYTILEPFRDFFERNKLSILSDEYSSLKASNSLSPYIDSKSQYIVDRICEIYLVVAADIDRYMLNEEISNYQGVVKKIETLFYSWKNDEFRKEELNFLDIYLNMILMHLETTYLGKKYSAIDTAMFNHKKEEIASKAGNRYSPVKEDTVNKKVIVLYYLFEKFDRNISNTTIGEFGKVLSDTDNEEYRQNLSNVRIKNDKNKKGMKRSDFIAAKKFFSDIKWEDVVAKIDKEIEEDENCK